MAALAARDVTTPFPIQALVIADLLAGRDVAAQAPTGSGKTLAFGLPILDALAGGPSRRRGGPSALILVPTRELALQVAAELSGVTGSRRLQVATAFGGVGLHPQAAAAARSAVLVACPGRLNDLLDRRMVDLSGVRHLVLDEADRMLDMGFAPQVERILARAPSTAERQTALFSATLDGAAGALAARHTRDAVRHTVSAQTADDARTTLERVEHRFATVPTAAKVDALLAALTAGHHEKALVFTRTKHGADKLVKRLEAGGVRSAALHGNKSQSQRVRTLDGFVTGRVPVLVATDIAARGIDAPGVTHVVNFDIPAEASDYVHRVGRTARAGRGGTALTLVTAEQEAEVAVMTASIGVESPYAVPVRQQHSRPAANGNRPSGRNRSGRAGRPRRATAAR